MTRDSFRNQILTFSLKISRKIKMKKMATQNLKKIKDQSTLIKNPLSLKDQALQGLGWVFEIMSYSKKKVPILYKSNQTTWS